MKKINKLIFIVIILLMTINAIICWNIGRPLLADFFMILAFATFIVGFLAI